MGWRIGIDVGGTFTDFVLVDGASGKVVHYKEPSTPADPARAVETGVAALLDAAAVAPGDVDLIVHGTTISLNSILQRRGAKVALVGANGAGKSVLMRLMHGLLAPTSGRLRWSVAEADRVRRQQAMVFQRPVMLRAQFARESKAQISHFFTSTAGDIARHVDAH